VRFALLLALASCAPLHALTHPGKPQPMAAYVADMAAFSAGSIVGINEFNKRPDQRDDQLMWSAFAVALIPWVGYWLVETR
jgi:hypothetical protein